MKNLSVPYSSQWDSDASATRTDCGPACIKMVLEFFKEKYTTDEIFEKSGAAVNALISISQMKTAINNFGFNSEFLTGVTPDQIKAFIDRGIPVIALVHYGNLTSRQDVNFTGGHFVVVVGYRDDGYFVNDPDFWGNVRADGDHHFYTKSDFEAALTNTNLDGNPRNSILVIYPKNVDPVVPSIGIITDSGAKIDLSSLDHKTALDEVYGVLEIQEIEAKFTAKDKEIKSLGNLKSTISSTTQPAIPVSDLSLLTRIRKALNVLFGSDGKNQT